LYAAWREGGGDPNVLAEVGSPVGTILRVADKLGVDLIVLGVSGKHELRDRFGGNGAYRIVCSAQCPVLTVRETFPGPYFGRLLEMGPPTRSSNSKKGSI
jgi:nucleotide-binding universal stress UspA family protein